MVVKYIISKSGFTEDFIARIWEDVDKDTPGAFVDEIVLPEKNGAGVPTPGAGHQVIEVVEFGGLDKVVHYVRLIGAVSGNIYHEYSAEPRTDLVTVFDPIQFKIGDTQPNTPAANQAAALTPELAGLLTSEFSITRNNYGILFPDIHFSFDQPTGAWNLLNGDVFSPNEEFTIMRLPQKIDTVVNDSVVGKWIGPTYVNPDLIVDVVANISYDATHLRKLIRFNGAFTYAFDINPPSGYGFLFQNFGNPQATATVAFNNAPLAWGTTTVSSVNIPPLGQAAFVFDSVSGQWNVIYISGAAPTGGPAPSSILGSGLFNIGDVPAGDVDYVIVHNLGIVGDYIVLWSIKSNPSLGSPPTSRAFDNDVVGSWWHHLTDKPNPVQITLQEKIAGTQNLSIAWSIIKI